MNIPKIPCAILKCWQTPMLGKDTHDNQLPPPVTPPPVPAPYFAFTVLPGLPMAAKYSFTVLSSGNGVILRGSDAGSLIPHVGNPVNILLPIIILTSGSKTEIGVFSVQMENEPVAAAFPLVFATVNINCAGPTTSKKPAFTWQKNKFAFPALTNIVIAPNTHFVGMGIGDIIASAFQIAIDMLIQAAVNFGCSVVGSYISGNLLPKMFAESIAQGVATKAMLAAIENPRSGTAIGNAVGFFLGDFMLGSPIGYSGALPFSDQDGTAVGNASPYVDKGLAHGIANPLNNFFNGGEAM